MHLSHHLFFTTLLTIISSLTHALPQQAQPGTPAKPANPNSVQAANNPTASLPAPDPPYLAFHILSLKVPETEFTGLDQVVPGFEITFKRRVDPHAQQWINQLRAYDAVQQGASER